MDSNATNERRRTKRQPVHRRALFSGEDGALRVGEVADAGAGGFRIRTDAPARVGSELSIEVHSATGEWLGALRLRGRVVYSAGVGADGIMGVRLLPDRTRTHPGMAHLYVPPVHEPEWNPEIREPIALMSAKKRLWPWLMPPAVLAFLLFLFLLRVQSLPAGDTVSGSDAPMDRLAAVDSFSMPIPSLTAKPVTPAANTPVPSDKDLLHPIRPVPPMPLESFERVEGTIGSVRLASTGRAPGTEATTPTDGLPWIYAQSSAEGAQAALVPESEWQSEQRTAGKASDSEVLVVVEKSTHRLTLSRNGVILRTFDVGLGRNDSTPEGEFRIAVKATNPAWRHVGRIIPGGSPENRLGKRWMGLAKGKTTTSYGIHPAKNTRAIGGNTSFGCIQMYPDDADTLFRFCPLGTRVSIRA